MKFLSDKKVLYRLLFNIGILLFVAGIVIISIKGEDFKRIAGTGIGLGVVLIGLFSSRLYLYDAEKKNPELFRKKNIEANDERNILIRDKAFAKANNILVWLIFAVIVVLGFFDVALYVPLTLGALIVINGVFFILYYRYYNKRM